MGDIVNKPTIVSREKGKPWFRNTLHPVTLRVVKAEWIPDHFGRNMYGVKFPGDPRVYRPRELPASNAAGREPYTRRAPEPK